MDGQAKAPSSVKALVSALLAIFVCPIIGSILAIVFGNATMREINESGGTLGGSFEGRFAQIVGWVTLLVVPATILAITLVAALGGSTS